MSSGKELLDKYFKKVSVLNYYSPGTLPFGCPNPKYYIVNLGRYELKLVQAKMANRNFLTLKVGMALIKEWESKNTTQLENDIKDAYSIIIKDARSILTTLGVPLNEV